jgi:hypothetical protein
VFEESIPIHINWVYDPTFQQAWHLQDDKKENIVERCKNIMHPWDYENVKQHLSKPRNETLYKQFHEFNGVLDSL